MTWFADMASKTFVASGDHVRAVGWLAEGHPYATAPVYAAFLSRLKEFCRRWGDSTLELNWGLSAGVHTCELCGNYHAAGNLGVPGGDVLFVAPEMIAHYVEGHGYAPPPEFIAAVLSAPLPGSDEYRAAISRFRRLR